MKTKQILWTTPKTKPYDNLLVRVSVSMVNHRLNENQSCFVNHIEDMKTNWKLWTIKQMVVCEPKNQNTNENHISFVNQKKNENH